MVELGEARYVMERLLGAGGMGEVYLAVRVMGDGPIEWRTSERVAVKVVRRDLAALVGGNAGPFIDEARLHLALDHPNVVKVHGVVEQDATLYLVMDFLEGRDLRALLELAASAGRRLSEAAICNVLAQVADALDYVHRATGEEGTPLHIVHRDVSPSNIRVTDSGVVKLMDFGVAWSTQEDRLETRSSESVYKGKLTYLSPEQANHQPLDGRSDSFSLGCILVEALTGRQPFEVGHDVLVLHAIRTVSPEFVEQVTPGVPPGLKAICHKLLAREPTERYATGKEVAAALRAYAFERGYLLDSASLAAEVAELERLSEGATPATERREPSSVKVTRRLSPVAGGVLILTLSFGFGGLAAAVYFRRPQPPTPVEYVPMPAQTPQEAPATVMQEQPPPGLRKIRAPIAKKCMVAGALVAASACPLRIPTTPRAGECTVAPVREAQVGEYRWQLPEVIGVDFVSINGKECTGRSLRDYPPSPDWPCPAESGTIVVEASGGPDCPNCPGRVLLVGRARVFDGKETIHDDDGQSYEATGRIVALFTELRVPNGPTFPICGALFDSNDPSVKNKYRDLGPEGIPILDPKYFHGPSSAPGWPKVKLFWPR